ncbi:TatD family deoxyribonuclease [Vibrio genomosp. F6]|uniref:TatD family hydrolase n=1 Tax=Vibrio TaxID=662 RepID=UPI0010BDD162|nr:TatD family hydrolase [Vibrio genomosp. F6]TKF20611.1 TatD family deoxyribonuclease [Vibrio genomosp. F6]
MNDSIRLFDTHCHFDFEPYRQHFSDELEAAKNQGVEKILIPSIGMKNWAEIQRLSIQHDEISYALGFHPYFLNDYLIEDIDELERELQVSPTKCVAIGECGLDFAIDIDPQQQEAFFIRQIQLANLMKLPLILHCRKAHNRMIQLLKKHRPEKGGVLHGFSGSYQQAMNFVALGFYIGVGGVITYPRANKTRQAIACLPLTSLVLETDAPDMPINGCQGRANHPKNVINIFDELVLIRKETEQTVASQVWENSHSLFAMCE